MQSIHLNIQDSVYEQFLSFLGKFENNEVTVIEESSYNTLEDKHFTKDKEEMHKIYDRYKSGNSKKYTQQEFESIMNESNSK